MKEGITTCDALFLLLCREFLPLKYVMQHVLDKNKNKKFYKMCFCLKFATLNRITLTLY